jgi:small-conductance mechanosensitive channel
MEPVMKTRQWITIAALFLLIMLAIAGFILTRESGSPVTTKARRARLVDQRPLETARNMAALAQGRDEQRLAQQALRIADHEVDLAFTDAMRQAKEHPVPPTAETKELYARVNRANAQMTTDQELADELKKEAAIAKGSKLDDVQQQLDLVQAQLELDKDELEDAKGDLIRSGADPLSLIQRQFARYQATQHEMEARAQSGANTPEVSVPTDNLIARFQAWHRLRGKAAQLQQAYDEARQAGEALQQQHKLLEERVSNGTEDKAENGNRAPQQTTASASSSQQVIEALRRLSDSQKDLADLDKRIQDHQELLNIYSSWTELVKSQQRAAVHGMLQSGLLILLVVLGVYLIGRLIERYFTALTAERKRLRTLRVVISFAVQAVGLLLIVFVLFGTPSQLTTILGLAGAGLTVALKDFIVAFFGWFALMGRNGLRVGDWVEINGVVGEVVEIGLLRTVLLETGNWTDSGHPTGRKVAFVNSFAIEGHFFNFSTSGQWLWDELQVLIPAGRDPYPILQAIQKLVTAETENNARMATEEWKRASTRQRVQSVSAAPAINLRPTSSGVEVHVRYITRANERYATRTKLYQELVGLLHHKPEDVAGNSEESGGRVTEPNLLPETQRVQGEDV